MPVQNKPTEEQIAKLPAWAREHVARLEREKDSLERTNGILRAAIGKASPDGSNSLVTFSVLMDDFPLPDSTDVRFSFGQEGDSQIRRYIEIGFKASDLNQGKRVLYLRGSDGIVIQPHAGNMISVRLAERGKDEW